MFQQSKMCSERESKQLELLRLTSHLKIFTSSKLNWCIVRGVTAYCWSTPMYLFRKLHSHCAYHFKSSHRKKKCTSIHQAAIQQICWKWLTVCMVIQTKDRCFRLLSDILEDCPRLRKDIKHTNYLPILEKSTGIVL